MTPDFGTYPADSLMPRDTRKSLLMALLRAREMVMIKFRPVLASRDISEQQWRVLRVLAEYSPLDATEVADRACLLAPSLTRIMRTLEDRQLITRERDQSDARRVRLAITPAGAEMISDVAPSSRAVYDEIEKSFGRERIEHLLDMLGEFAILKH